MRAAIFVSSIVALLTLSEARGTPQGEIISGFQCVGLNAKSLNLSAEDIWTGARNPWILDAPSNDAKLMAKVPNIVYIAWPPVVENGFLKAMSLGGKIGWLEEKAVRPLRRADGTTGGCTLRRRPDGGITLSLDPGVGVAY
jgi:hypothetical protein